jgi:hypothetical protein
MTRAATNAKYTAKGTFESIFQKMSDAGIPHRYRAGYSGLATSM